VIERYAAGEAGSACISDETAIISSAVGDDLLGSVVPDFIPFGTDGISALATLRFVCAIVLLELHCWRRRARRATGCGVSAWVDGLLPRPRLQIEGVHRRQARYLC